MREYQQMSVDELIESEKALLRTLMQKQYALGYKDGIKDAEKAEEDKKLFRLRKEEDLQKKLDELDKTITIRDDRLNGFIASINEDREYHQ